MPKIPTLPSMLIHNTPIEDYTEEYGLWVKREDLACPAPGPPFSKTRGVYAHVRSRPEKLIGVLDTAHSQAGHAVARACQILGKQCINFYPVYKKETEDNGEHELRKPQLAAQVLGAELIALPAGRSCILYHAAKRQTQGLGGYMMPNALKLEESVTETAKECPKTQTYDQILIPASSGTIAAGVIKGMGGNPLYLIHMGYSRSKEDLREYLRKASGADRIHLELIDEGYAYKDVSRAGEVPPWPCNAYYDLKAFRWWIKNREKYGGKTLMWNIG